MEINVDAIRQMVWYYNYPITHLSLYSNYLMVMFLNSTELWYFTVLAGTPIEVMKYVFSIYAIRDGG